MTEARQFARGSHLRAELFFLQGPEPAPRPAPQPHPAAHNPIGPIQAQFALQKGLGGVVVAETGGLPIAVDVEALGGEEAFGLRAGLVAGDAEIDGSFRECAVEVARREPDGGRQQEGTNRQEAVVGAAEAFRHWARPTG